MLLYESSKIREDEEGMLRQYICFILLGVVMIIQLCNIRSCIVSVECGVLSVILDKGQDMVFIPAPNSSKIDIH